MLDEEEASYDLAHVKEMNIIYGKKLKKVSRPSALIPILEPVPCEDHIYCAICEKKFDDYLTHIHSEEHLNCS
jgi:hypothetical protein